MNTEITVVRQGAVRVNPSALIREHSDRVVLIELGVHPKYFEMFGVSYGEGRAPEIALGTPLGGDMSLTEIGFSDEFIGWEVFSDTASSYTMRVALAAPHRGDGASDTSERTRFKDSRDWSDTGAAEKERHWQTWCAAMRIELTPKGGKDHD